MATHNQKKLIFQVMLLFLRLESSQLFDMKTLSLDKVMAKSKNEMKNSYPVAYIDEVKRLTFFGRSDKNLPLRREVLQTFFELYKSSHLQDAPFIVSCWLKLCAVQGVTDKEVIDKLAKEIEALLPKLKPIHLTEALWCLSMMKAKHHHLFTKIAQKVVAGMNYYALDWDSIVFTYGNLQLGLCSIHHVGKLGFTEEWAREFTKKFTIFSLDKTIEGKKQIQKPIFAMWTALFYDLPHKSNEV